MPLLNCQPFEKEIERRHSNRLLSLLVVCESTVNKVGSDPLNESGLNLIRRHAIKARPASKHC
jgi:hypothetical protein